MPDALDGLSVVLVATRNPLNIGAAARAVSNFGFSSLRLVNPYEVAFREARSAVGAAALLKKAKVFPNVADAVADCSLVVGTTAARNRELQQPLRRLEEGSRAIRARLRKGRVALLFGSEKRGLSNDDFGHCHWLVRIPTHEGNPSMNLGQAVAVCLYELIRKDRIPPHLGKDPVATGADLERMTAALSDLLRVSGYTTPKTEASSEQKLRRMVRRLDLSARDAELWLGMLRQIAWKLGKRV